jgi:hypothetical protein
VSVDLVAEMNAASGFVDADEVGKEVECVRVREWSVSAGERKGRSHRPPFGVAARSNRYIAETEYFGRVFSADLQL